LITSDQLKNKIQPLRRRSHRRQVAYYDCSAYQIGQTVDDDQRRRQQVD